MTTESKENTSITGYACKAKGKPCEPWSYEPRPLGAEDVHIKITHCGICYSDIHTMDSDWGACDYPVITGHEIVGIVTEIGKDVKDIKVGDRVGVGAMVDACRTCKYCKTDNDSYCDKVVFTYNSKYPDGSKAYGGYADGVRVPALYTFVLPSNLESSAAAPLLCAGVTVYAPLAHFKAGPGKRVAVIGIGGLGHLAVQYAAKMGAEVTAISHSDDKKDLSKQLGAHHFLNNNDAEAMKKAKRGFDLVICTVNKMASWNDFFQLCDLDGVFVFVGLPNEAIPLRPGILVSKRVHLTGSLIGGHKEVKETLEFAAKHGVRAFIEELPMSRVNEGIQRMRDGKARFRVVLHNENGNKA